MVDDLAITIMNERLEAGVEMVKKIALKEEKVFSEAVFIKGLEAGISLFIQKETGRRNTTRRQ